MMDDDNNKTSRNGASAWLSVAASQKFVIVPGGVARFPCLHLSRSGIAARCRLLRLVPKKSRYLHGAKTAAFQCIYGIRLKSPPNIV